MILEWDYYGFLWILFYHGYYDTFMGWIMDDFGMGWIMDVYAFIFDG